MNSSKIKVISFDLDDTLYDNRPVIQRAEALSKNYLHQEFSRQGVDFSYDRFLKLRQSLLADNRPEYENVSLLRRQVLNAFCRELKGSAMIAERAFEIFIHARSEVDIVPEIASMLLELSQEFVIVSVTNGNCDINQLSIAKQFDKHYSPIQKYRAKPHPQMLRQVLEDFHLAPKELLHVGDSLDKDGVAAEAASTHFYQLAPFANSEEISTQVHSFQSYVKQILST